MPSTYAHYRFAQQVLQEVRYDLRKQIEDNIELYNIGLHGPDILFYYKPLYSNSINRKGFELHEKPAIGFFREAKKIIEGCGKENIASYIYGFTCHFILDSECHTYIENKIKSSGVSHTEIEVEFDRMLMIEDGLDPIRQSLTEHINDSVECAKNIAHFWSNTSVKSIQESLTYMKKYNKLLIAPSKLKRRCIYMLLKLTHNYEEMKGLVVNYEANPACVDSCEELKVRYKAAIKQAAALIEEFDHILYTEENLNNRYQVSFGAQY